MKKNYAWRVFIDSFKIILITSIISSIGGTSIQSVSERFLKIMPIIIMLPAMNDMAGDFGTIISSKFTTMLYLGTINSKNVLRSKRLKSLFFKILLIGLIAAIYISIMSSVMSLFSGYKFDLVEFLKILFVACVSTICLVGTNFFVAIIAGFHVYKHNHDPDNFLIPLTTAFGDVGMMIIISVLTIVFF